ncbi:taste receptor type 2 member 7-like [Ambystoma mexicanum]|uniref:taste receptor type 2 member 7-like n=1 Tax=Ambystoma mexicanum TaxID=8296 RepID=UPI0037E97661
MLSSNTVVGMIIPQIECTIGIVLNAFIVAVNAMDWVKSRCLTSVDIILTCVGAFRFCLLWLFLLDTLFNELTLECVNTLKYLNVTTAFWVFFDYAILWFMAWLAIIFCLNIVHYSNSLFIRIKQNISKMVPWFILGTVVSASGTSIPFAWTYCNIHFRNSSIDSSWNSTMESPTTNINVLYLFPTLCLLCLPPFSIICISALLLIKSLWFHTRRMKQSAEFFRNASLQPHFHAIKTILSFTVIYVCYVVAAILCLPGVMPPNGEGYLVLKMSVYVLPTVHSIVVINGNSKLKGTFTKLFHPLRCTTVNDTPERKLG